MAQHQRKLSNMFVQPKFQLKLSLIYMFVGGLILCAVGLVVLQITSGVEDLMNNNPIVDFRVQGQINDLMLQCVQASLLGFGIFILFSFVFALVVSHRIAGPQVAISAYIEALKQGDYDYQRNLRPRDELADIMDGLKALAPILKERDKNLVENQESKKASNEL
jgi:signal transduction histidine kinase